jgi:hypothetical protein
MQQKLSGKTLEKARWLAQDGRVVRTGEGEWAVESSSVCVGAYIVSKTACGYACECKSYYYRQDCCHARAVAIFENDDPWASFEREGGEEEPAPFICQRCGDYVPNGLDLCQRCGVKIWRDYLRNEVLVS